MMVLSRSIMRVAGAASARRIIKEQRSIVTAETLWKRRKTAEEKKSPRIIEYTSKKNSNVSSVDIWRLMTVRQLADSMERPLEDIQEVMLHVRGVQNIDGSAFLDDIKVLNEIVKKCGRKPHLIAAPSPERDDGSDVQNRDVIPQPPAALELLRPRPPVVTVMGHVDHGKTTLLDALRGSAVAAGEAGGITQHIGAFTVTLPTTGEQVTFLDTPGHAAFSAMRARGAYATDIIVLVVAAEDGVMAQTREVIKLAQETDVPIIVAVNKIDKPEADVERSKRELAQMGLIPEDQGGDVQVVPVSALKGTNLELLTEAVSTQATLMGLTADFTGLVEGIVVESRTDPHRGKLSTAIVTRGTLHKGSVLVSGLAHAKVRGLFDHNGQPVQQAVPGTPVEILGWRELPLAGDIILEVESEKKAHSVLRWRQQEAERQKGEQVIDEIRKKEEEHLVKYRAERDARRMAGYFRTRHGPRQKESLPDDGIPRVSVIIKGDVHGSVEAILDVLQTYHSNDRCRLDIVHYGVGNITENDLELARTFDAIVYGFSVPIPTTGIPTGVVVRSYNVIYRLIDNLKEELTAKLPSVHVEEVLGEANVLQFFSITEGRKEVPVAGCRCIKGVLKKSEKFRLLRSGEVVYEGTLDSMRHLKNEVDTVKKDVECGLRFKDIEEMPQPGDVVVCYTTHLEAQKTDWDPGF